MRFTSITPFFAAEAVFAVVHERQAIFPAAQVNKFLAGYLILRFFNAVVFSRFSLDMTEGDVEAAFVRFNRGREFNAQHPAFLMAVNSELYLQRGAVIHQMIIHGNRAVSNAVGTLAVAHGPPTIVSKPTHRASLREEA